MEVKGIDVEVCFKDDLHDTFVTVETDDEKKAEEIARKWGGSQGSEVTEVSVRGPVTFKLAGHDEEVIDGVKVWPLPF